MPSGATIWLTGLPSSGKSTLAAATAAHLEERGERTSILDGDEVRRHLSSELGFSAAERHLNVERIGYVASLLTRSGCLTLVAAIAPYRRSRDGVRALHREAGLAYAEVHVATPVAICAERDVKGLYARQRAGELAGLTGVDDPYEEPSAPELTLATQLLTLTECVERIAALAARATTSDAPYPA
jgi:adenylylsulfate kinase